MQKKKKSLQKKKDQFDQCTSVLNKMFLKQLFCSPANILNSFLGMIGFLFFHNLIQIFVKKEISLLFSPLRVDSWNGDFGPIKTKHKKFILHTKDSIAALLHIV